jgi:hypothetical protein
MHLVLKLKKKTKNLNFENQINNVEENVILSITLTYSEYPWHEFLAINWNKFCFVLLSHMVVSAQ